MDLGAFFAASNLKTPQKTGLSAPIPQHQHGTLAGFPKITAQAVIPIPCAVPYPGQFSSWFLLTIPLVQSRY
jgi:hypothetical protein